MTLGDLILRTVNLGGTDVREFISGQQCKCPECKSIAKVEPSRQSLGPKAQANLFWAIIDCPKCGKVQRRTSIPIELPDPPAPEPADHKKKKAVTHGS